MTDPKPQKKPLGIPMPRIKMIDSDGRESRVLAFVSVAFWVTTVKYFVSGLTLPLFGLQAVVTMNEYAMSFMMIVGVYIGREWVKKPTAETVL